MISVEPRDVIGPLPSDSSSLIVLRAGDKMFPVACATADADACHKLIRRHGRQSFWEFMPPLFDAVGAKPIRATLARQNMSLYSFIDIEARGRKKPQRISTDMPAYAILVSLSSGCPLVISEADLEAIRNSSSVFSTLKRSMPCLWPMSPLTDTRSMQAVSEYLDVAMPSGSVFVQTATK